MDLTAYDGPIAPPTKRRRAKPGVKLLSAVFALAGASILMGDGSVGGIYHYARSLCEDIPFLHSGEPYGVWQELYPTGQVNYFSAEFETSQEVPDLENNIGFVLPILECPDKEPWELPGYPQDAPTGDSFWDIVTMGKFHICDECGIVTIGDTSYNATMWALVAEDAIECMSPEGVLYDRVQVLQEIGFNVKIIGAPISSEEIVDEYLRENVETDVGLKDTLRFHAWNLTMHPLVVLMDFDTQILRPLNDAFAALLGSTAPVSMTMDYPPVGVPPTGINFGVNTGFILIKPSTEEFDSIVEAYKTTPFDPVSGWASGGIVGFPGAMGTSGFIHHYYHTHAVNPIMLDHCLYNNDNEGHLEGSVCRDGETSCEDCRETNIHNIYVSRLNEKVCDKPTNCPDDFDGDSLCHHFHQIWFTKRSEYEQVHFELGPKSAANGNFKQERFHGFCDTEHGYQKILMDGPNGVTLEAKAGTPDIPLPDMIGTQTCGDFTCPAGQYVTQDCTCSTDECDACPDMTRCQKRDAANGISPMCIDCECGFCDYDGGACCDFNGVNNCKSATNKNECAMQNANFPGWPGTGNACSGVEISATATPNGCGCQPNELTPCTYNPNLRKEDDKCFITRAQELLQSNFDKMAESTVQSVATAIECADCISQCEGGDCIHGDGQTDVHHMQDCLGNSIGKKRAACRTNCGSKCIKVDNANAVIPPGNAFGYETQYQ